MQNADRIHPEWQHRELGETVHLHPAGGLRVSVFNQGARSDSKVKPRGIAGGARLVPIRKAKPRQPRAVATEQGERCTFGLEDEQVPAHALRWLLLRWAKRGSAASRPGM
jgi:hypothetical protein